MDLDLEADLGIDTVKQAEMFASVRAAYNIPRDENIKLRDFPTLGARDPVCAAEGRSDSRGGRTLRRRRRRKGQTRPRRRLHLHGAETQRQPSLNFDATNRVPRRVPVPNLRPPLNICKPTGVTLGAGSRVVVMPDSNGVADALTKQLQTMGVEVLLIEGAPDADTLDQSPQDLASCGCQCKESTGYPRWTMKAASRTWT